jgi:hypothetical protein
MSNSWLTKRSAYTQVSVDSVVSNATSQFGQGDGLLNYYLYNWRTSPLAGVNAVSGKKVGTGVGLVML